MEGAGEFNIIEILKMGLPGVVFLLSLLAFRLLNQEQKQSEPREKILRTIRQFMYLNVLFAILTLVSPIMERLWPDSGFHKSNIKSFIISGKLSDTPTAEGEAVVCQDADYYGRYLLLKDGNSGNLVQVFANKVMPCSAEKHYINLSPVDTKNLGWSETLRESSLEVSVAISGFKFSI